MPELQTRAPRRTSDHSLLISLGVSCLLVLGYALGLKAFSVVSMADGAVEEGEQVTVTELYPDVDTVTVRLPNGKVDRLTYVSDPADYRAPLDVKVWDQRDKQAGRDDQVVFAVQDLDHLAGQKTRRLLGTGFGGLVLVFVVAAVVLNRPRRRPEG